MNQKHTRLGNKTQIVKKTDKCSSHYCPNDDNLELKWLACDQRIRHSLHSTQLFWSRRHALCFWNLFHHAKFLTLIGYHETTPSPRQTTFPLELTTPARCLPRNGKCLVMSQGYRLAHAIAWIRTNVNHGFPIRNMIMSFRLILGGNYRAQCCYRSIFLDIHPTNSIQTDSLKNV